MISEKELPILKRPIIFPQESESCFTARDALSVFQISCSEIILMFLFGVFFILPAMVCAFKCTLNDETHLFSSELNHNALEG